MVVKIPYAEQANRMIREGVVIQYDLKLAETYDSKCRVTQCYKCQRYGFRTLGQNPTLHSRA